APSANSAASESIPSMFGVGAGCGDVVNGGDFGMRKLPHTAAEDLLEIIMRRYERASTVLTSKRWSHWLRPAPPEMAPTIPCHLFQTEIGLGCAAQPCRKDTWNRTLNT